MSNMDIGKRIKMIRKELKLTQKDFGVRIGIASNTITGYETGVRLPSPQVIRSICREFNVNEEWLSTGEGEMFRSLEENAMAAIDRIMFGENELAKSVFKAFASLSEEEWQTVGKLIDQVQKFKDQ